MAEGQTSPPIWRLMLGFVVAPAAAALVFAFLFPAYDGLPSFLDRVWRSFLIYVIVGGYPPTLLLGIPAFLVLKGRLKPTPLNCALVGATIASLPWLLLGLFSSPNYASTNGHVTYNNGVITVWGLIDLATFVAQLAALGSFAGREWDLSGTLDKIGVKLFQLCCPRVSAVERHCILSAVSTHETGRLS